MPVGSVQGHAPSWVHVDEFLADLPLPTLDRFLAQGVPRSVPRGETCFRSVDAPPRGGIVVEGLARVYLEAADGRKLTLRFARPGSMVGVVTSLMGDTAPVNTQAVTDSVILELPIAHVSAMAKDDPAFSWALAQEVSHRLLDTIESLAEATFGTVRGRLARHMLDLADGVDASGHLVVRITNQALADSIGTVREVVARHLADLRDEGSIETNRGLITVLQPEVLAGLAGQWMPRHR